MRWANISSHILQFSPATAAKNKWGKIGSLFFCVLQSNEPKSVCAAATPSRNTTWLIQPSKKSLPSPFSPIRKPFVVAACKTVRCRQALFMDWRGRGMQCGEGSCGNWTCRSSFLISRGCPNSMTLITKHDSIYSSRACLYYKLAIGQPNQLFGQIYDEKEPRSQETFISDSHCWICGLFSHSIWNR